MFKLRSKVEIKLLSYFFMNPEKEEYLLELARILDVDPGNLDKKLMVKPQPPKMGSFEPEGFKEIVI